MRTAVLLTTLLPLLSSASPLASKRDAATVLADLKDVGAKASALNDIFNSFGAADSPNTATIIKIQSANSAVNDAITKSTKDANASPVFDAAGSKSVGAFVNNTLAPGTIAVLDNTVKHLPGLKKAGIAGLVKDSLTSQKKLVSAQVDAVTAKLIQPQKGQAPGVTQPILDRYDQVIAKFGKKKPSA